MNLTGCGSNWMNRLCGHGPKLPMLVIVTAMILPSCAAVDDAGRVDHSHLHHWSFAICDGRGGEAPPGWTDDHFALLLRQLEHENVGIRQTVAANLATSTGRPGHVYTFLLDAYIEQRRYDDMLSALLRAYGRARLGGWERYVMASAYCDARRRQFMWQNPQFAGSVGGELLIRGRRQWFPAGREKLIDLVLAAQGDEEFTQVLHDQALLVMGLRREYQRRRSE